MYPYASYVTVNISSPNTKNLRQLQGASELDALLSRLKQAQQALPPREGGELWNALLLEVLLKEARRATRRFQEV